MNRCIMGLLLIWVVFYAALGIKGFRDIGRADSIMGIYDVSWNAMDAIQRASQSEIETIYALDWGVFYPGVAISRQDQRWEMTRVNTVSELSRFDAVRKGREFGVLFKPSSSHRWLLNRNLSHKILITQKTCFSEHKGEPWMFMVIQTVTDGKTNTDLLDPTGSLYRKNLIKNGDFSLGNDHWRYEKYVSETKGADFILSSEQYRDCPFSALLIHRAPADSRIVQEVILETDTLYEVSSYIKTEGVGQKHKGAHLCMMDYNHIESRELKGDNDWQFVRFYIMNKTDQKKRVRIAGRLGTYGSMNTGSVWYDQFVVCPANGKDKDTPLFLLKK